MIHDISLVTWDTNYYIVDSAPSVEGVLSIDELVEDIAELNPDETLDCRVLGLQFDCDEDVDTKTYLEGIADNIVAMLDSDEVIIVSSAEFSLNFVENRGLGVSQHYTDIRRYYSRHPFI